MRSNRQGSQNAGLFPFPPERLNVFVKRNPFSEQAYRQPEDVFPSPPGGQRQTKQKRPVWSGFQFFASSSIDVSERLL
jgi:hypothetical protein